MLTTILFGVLFFGCILLSVALHEVGHMLPAKKFGVKVPSYSIGFGPAIWKRQFGETLFAVRWIFLGGYVRLLGMYPPASKRSRFARLSDLADDARSQEWEDITEADVAAGRLFYQKKTWQKVVVMFGGPFMNLLISFVIFSFIVGCYGTYEQTNKVAQVIACIPAAGANTCTDADPQTPAAQAGLQAGDVITGFNGTEITSQTQLSGLIRGNADGEVILTVDRGGETLTLPAVHTVIIEDPATETTPATTRGYLGYAAATERVTGGPGKTFSLMWDMTTMSYEALVKLPVSVYDAIVDVFSGEERGQDSPMSIVGASVVAGEVATAEGVDAGARIVMFASLLGSVNLFLALLNLIPLPPLDGGHIFAALYEWLKRKLSKAFKRPDPGYFDTAKILPVTYVAGAFLFLCGIILIVLDIIAPVQVFS
ncbi:MAG: site-2 protease family protein [Propionibacteriaceae bacterium]|jgi:membrane-associated protease RseP (regulator of RpoE activity)|nr:site-2 protease family protein [Propionibacteriaceae bacterium]